MCQFCDTASRFRRWSVAESVSPATVPRMSSLTQPWATLIAGAAVLLSAIIAASVAWYNRRQADRHFDDKHALERVEALHGRYTTAAEQIAHDSAAIRLAGVYAIAALADDWMRNGSEGDRQVCIDLLRAYMRTEQDRSASSTPGPEREVRRTILTTINQRRMLPSGDEKSWTSCDCSLSKADLSYLDLSELSLPGIDLTDAIMHRTRMMGTNLSGAVLTRVRILHTHPMGVNLENCKLDDAYFHGVSLVNANLKGADLRNATVWDSRLATANLEGANLTGVTYSAKTEWPGEYDPESAGARLSDSLY